LLLLLLLLIAVYISFTKLQASKQQQQASDEKEHRQDGWKRKSFLFNYSAVMSLLFPNCKILKDKELTAKKQQIERIYKQVTD